jgi:hypothetical protein
MAFDFALFEQRVRDDNKDGAGWVYRGQSSPEWKLETSFARYCGRRAASFSLEWFFEVLDAFISQAADFLAAELLPLSLCQRVALAQHHGIPTPFLDWTESPYVAAFFALTDRYARPTDGPFTVWAIKTGQPISDGADITREELLDVDEPFKLLRPRVYQSRRLSRQRGLFTFFGRDGDMEEYLRDAGVTVKRYDVAGKGWEQALSQLHLMGVSASNLFDDLDGVALDTLIRSQSSDAMSGRRNGTPTAGSQSRA